MFFIRDHSSFDKDKYNADIKTVNWSDVFQESKNLHEATSKTIQIITDITDKHALFQTRKRYLFTNLGLHQQYINQFGKNKKCFKLIFIPMILTRLTNTKSIQIS